MGLFMPRFVILWHEAGPELGRGSHFDLLFEEGNHARTWFVERRIEPNVELIAGALLPHRLFYFDYEGSLSDNRGAVSRWDRGEYKLLVADENRFEADVHGDHLVGAVRLIRRDANWILTYEPRDAPQGNQD
jgi:hypothetical protein